MTSSCSVRFIHHSEKYDTFHNTQYISHRTHHTQSEGVICFYYATLLPGLYRHKNNSKSCKKHSSVTFCISNCFKGLLFNTHEDLLSLWVNVIQMPGLSLVLKKPVTVYTIVTWWRHQMETFSALLAHGVRNSPVTGEFSSQRSVAQSLDVVMQFDILIRFALTYF